MKTKMLLAVEIMLTGIVAATVAYHGDALNLVIFAWFALSTFTSTWYIVRRVDAISEILGLGVSAMIADKHRTKKEFVPGSPEAKNLLAQKKRPRFRNEKSLFDELAALDDEA